MRARRERHRRHANPFSIRGEASPIDLRVIYKREAPLALDIGFGDGRFTRALAQQHPEWNVLGLEIRPHLVELLLDGTTPPNLHAIKANATSQLDALLPDGSVAFAALNFPDPWYKRRHHKRRVLNLAWLDMLGRKLRRGARFHYVSDYFPGAEAALKVLSTHAAFAPASAAGFLATSTTGFLTEREEIHMQRGDAIYRLCYERR